MPLRIMASGLSMALQPASCQYRIVIHQHRNFTQIVIWIAYLSFLAFLKQEHLLGRYRYGETTPFC